MRRAGPALVWLTVVWVALWEHLTAANLLGGLAAALVAVRLVPWTGRGAGMTVRPWATARLVTYFLWQLIEASAVVAWEVVTPRNRIQEGIVAVPLRGAGDLVTTIVANAVSLTPGTLSLETLGDPPVLYVHVLHLKGIDAVRRDVVRLEALVFEAFVPAAPEDRRGDDRSRAERP